MKDETLDELVKAGDISDYQYYIRDAEDNIVSEPNGSRNTEEVVITFPSGRRLVLGTFCSGSAENTVLRTSPLQPVSRKIEYMDAASLTTFLWILLGLFVVPNDYMMFTLFSALLLGWIPGVLWARHHNKKRLQQL